MLKQVSPALGLLVLAPIVAEFLLGDFSVRQLGFLAFFIPQYGGGARREIPWLGTRALVAVAVLYALGCALTIVSTHYVYPYVATIGQFMSIGVITTAVIVAAFILFD